MAQLESTQPPANRYTGNLAGHSPLQSLEDWHEAETSEFSRILYSINSSHKATWPFPEQFLLLAVHPSPSLSFGKCLPM